MLLLKMIDVLIALACGWLLLTQLVMPLIFGTRFFSYFRSSELKKKVEDTRDLVEDLKDQSQQLTELDKLLKQKSELEIKIADLEKPVASATNDGVK